MKNTTPDRFAEDEKDAYGQAYELGFNKEITNSNNSCRCDCGESQVMVFENTSTKELLSIGICSPCANQ